MKDNELSINSSIKDLQNSIKEETDKEELDKIVNLFNLNLMKKDLIRAGELSDLLDSVVNQMAERISKRGDEFSNIDLLNYFKIIQESQQKSRELGSEIPNARISLNQNNVEININSNEDKLDHDSKVKIMDAIRSIISNNKEEENSVEVDYIELDENKEQEGLENDTETDSNFSETI